MSTSNFRKPRLPSHFYVLVDPPDESGEEVLRFNSECRKIKLRGHSFREFQQEVIPLLDGNHTLEEIQAAVADTFEPEDLNACLQFLIEQNLLEDAEDSPLPADLRLSLSPQLNFLHEVTRASGRAQTQLLNATVAVLGLGGAGASVAASLAAAHVGTVFCIDDLPVAPTDPYLGLVYSREEVGNPRAEAVKRHIEAVAPRVKVSVNTKQLQQDADVEDAIQGADFVVCCLDPGQSSLAYKLNRVCLKTRVRWISCEAAGSDVIVGPTVEPYESACYLCYKMRLVAGNDNPEDEFAFQRFLDGRKQDDSGRRENLIFGVGLAANLVGLETLKALTGMLSLATRGRLVVLDLLELETRKHVVLRKPWCPACSQPPAENPDLKQTNNTTERSDVHNEVKSAS